MAHDACMGRPLSVARAFGRENGTRWKSARKRHPIGRDRCGPSSGSTTSGPPCLTSRHPHTLSAVECRAYGDGETRQGLSMGGSDSMPMWVPFARRFPNTTLPKKERIEVTPHVLRHTALRKMAEKKGIRYAQQMAGHASSKYIWRYVQPSRDDMENAVEELFD